MATKAADQPTRAMGPAFSNYVRITFNVPLNLLSSHSTLGVTKAQKFKKWTRDLWYT